MENVWWWLELEMGQSAGKIVQQDEMCNACVI